eukprot:Seg2112.5 transcript_id=Seg2112.5/GoldUCD/mRNA.D3Y31 product=Ficolin-1 protein_id=Seg2112.5/GoldUCD/D3Y31
MERMKQESKMQAGSIENNLVLNALMSLMLVTIVSLSAVGCAHQTSIGTMKNDVLTMKHKYEHNVVQLGQEVKRLKENLSPLKSGDNLQAQIRILRSIQSDPGLSKIRPRIPPKAPSAETRNAAPTATVTPRQMLVKVEMKVELTCNANGNPKPSIKWGRVGGKMPSSAVSWPNRTLIIENIKKSDGGLYKCIASNYVGRGKASATILVQDRKPTSCKSLLHTGKQASGEYTIWINGATPTKAYCDMQTDGGGWTVIQRRRDASTYFNRGWREYKRGFGDKSHNFWLGLDAIHSLTAQGATLRIDLVELSGKKGFAKYNRFRVGNESSNYALEVSGFSGNAGNCLRYNNKAAFSTKDRDNDWYVNGNCAADFRQGPWWYPYYCGHSNLNGLYPASIGEPDRMTWYTLSHKFGSIKFSEMKVRSAE